MNKNAIAGMSNNYLSKLLIKCYKPSQIPSIELPSDKKVMTVGNPYVRLSCTSTATKAIIDVNDTSPLKLLVIGGSLGAQALNNHIAPTLKIRKYARRQAVASAPSMW